MHEIENILCDELLLEAARNQFLSSEDSISKSKQKLFELLSKDIEQQALLYATQKINNQLKNNMIHNQKSVDNLVTEINLLSNNIDVKRLYSERINLLNNIIANKDYALGLKHYNNKGLICLLTKHIVSDYNHKIFELLQISPDLVDELKNKYFNNIQLEN